MDLQGRVTVITFEKASDKDAIQLAKVQTRTFDDDSRRYLGSSAGGPPGYDSPHWQIRMIHEGIYFKILNENNLIGGIIVFKAENSHYVLGRIFIDPGFQNIGIGSQAMRFLEEHFKDARKWTLRTPEWATRNHYFYSKCGFMKIGNTELLPEGFMEFQFEKIIG